MQYSSSPLIRPPYSGADPGGVGGAPKTGKNMIFWHKIVIFHTNNFRASLRNWKIYDFLA